MIVKYTVEFIILTGMKGTKAMLYASEIRRTTQVASHNVIFTFQSWQALARPLWAEFLLCGSGWWYMTRCLQQLLGCTFFPNTGSLEKLQACWGIENLEQLTEFHETPQIQTDCPWSVGAALHPELLKQGCLDHYMIIFCKVHSLQHLVTA